MVLMKMLPSFQVPFFKPRSFVPPLIQQSCHIRVFIRMDRAFIIRHERWDFGWSPENHLRENDPKILFTKSLE
jgi:hypothetical protein